MLYSSLADINISLTTIFLAGLIIGIFSGAFGKLAGIIIVPALNIIGLPISISVSSGAGICFGSASLSLFSPSPAQPGLRRVGITAGIIGLPGVYIGLRLHLLMVENALATPVILLVYSAMLLCASVVLYRQWIFFQRNDYFEEAPFPPFGLNWKIPLAVPGGSGLKFITLSRVALTGLLLGIASGFLGLGAGILGIPLFMYIMGLPPKNSLATDSIAMLIISAGTLLSYAAAGRVEFTTVFILAGAVTLGSRIGSILPGEINLSHARLAFALLLALYSLSSALALHNAAASRVIVLAAGLALCALIAVFSAVSERTPYQEKGVARNKNIV